MRIITIFYTAASLSLLVVSACSGGEEKYSSAQPKILTHQDTVQRGAFLVETLGCNDCHSPKRMTASGPEIIPELMLSGYPADRKLADLDKDALKKGWLLFAPDLTAAAGPWGVSFAGNLTPDPSGIGLWPYDNFKRALTQGKFKGIEGSRTLLPPMPWQNYTNLPDEDVRAIFAYLKSIKPVQNIVPAAVPPMTE